MSIKTFVRGDNEYAVKVNKEGKVEAVRNVTSNQAVPLKSDTGKRIAKGDRRYILVVD